LFLDGAAGEELREWLRLPEAALSVIVAGRSDELATTYRGLAADVRRTHRGVLLRPSVVDGELLGVRLDRRALGGPPGRGVIVGPPSWGPEFAAGEAVAIQIAQPEESICG
jgi:S-DNA-T family DNA segregation ATPase FtsK/SpoIIIE